MEQLTLSSRPPDSDRGGVAVYGLLELQGKFGPFHIRKIAYSR